ncbi:MAG TPA: TrkA family potassium uptake protein [Actinomycetota bacterium]|nr:TrkA family potassium uptake protein [Actinomycetota bacterium]
MRYVVIGCGKVGSRLALNLVDDGHEVAVVAGNVDAFRRLPSDFAGSLVVGSGVDEDVLERAGTRGADALAAVSEDDNLNIMAAELGRSKFGVRNVVARVYDIELAEFYAGQGIRTVCPTVTLVSRVRDALESES